MKLFYVPGACSFAPHLASRELGIPLQLELMIPQSHTLKDGSDYYAINPKGAVPALQLDDGQVLTEVSVILLYLADLKPEAGMAVPHGSLERYRLLEWLNFIATDVHKQISTLYNPKLTEEARAVFLARAQQRLSVVDKRLAAAPWLMERFSVADVYLYTVLRWARKFNIPVAPSLVAFLDRMDARPAAKATLEAEGLG